MALHKVLVALHLLLEDDGIRDLAEAEVDDTALIGVMIVDQALNWAHDYTVDLLSHALQR